MKKILVINLHSTRNAGDHALLQLALAKIYAFIPDVEVTLSTNDPDSFVSTHGQEKVVTSFFYWYARGKPTRLWRNGLQVLRLTILAILLGLWFRFTGQAVYWGIPQAQRPLLKAYFETDLVISCPGNFIYSRPYMAGLPLLMPLFTILYAWLVDKPIFMLPQTVGPLQRGWERWLLRWILRRMHTVAVRDLISVSLLQELGFTRDEYYLVPDLAFQLPSAGAAQAIQLLHRHGIDPTRQRPLLGVTMINWGAQNNVFRNQHVYERAVAETVRIFVEEQGGTVVIFPQVCGPKPSDDDRIPAQRVHALLEGTAASKHTVVIEAEYSPALLKAAYGQMNLFLGSRLHSNIFALAEGVPVIAIAYQEKTPGVLRMLNLGDWVIAIEEVNATRLVDLYRAIWPRRAALSAQIQTSLHSLAEETERTMETIYTEMAVKLQDVK